MSTKSDDFIDITDLICPITFVKSKMKLEDLDAGQILEVKMNEGEPISNLPRSFRDEGHKVVQVDDNGDGTYNVFFEKDGLV